MLGAQELDHADAAHVYAVLLGDEDGVEQLVGRLVVCAHRLDRHVHGRAAHDPDVVGAHHPARGRRVVLQQLAQLVLLARRHHVEDRLAPLLVELTEEVGRVVGGHALEDPRRLVVRLRAQELHLVLGVELLEDVGGQGGVALDGLDDLLALLVRGALDDVGDLRRVQAAEPLQGHQELGGRHLADERLDVLPIEDDVAAKVGPGAARQQAAQHGLRAAVDAREVPAVGARRQDEVVRLHDPALDHVDEVSPEHVGREQHLAWTALERLGADGVRLQAHGAGLEGFDDVLADEHVLRTDAHLHPGHGRIGAVGELDDEVLDASDLGPRGVQHRAAKDLRHHQAALVVAVLRSVHASVAHWAIIHLPEGLHEPPAPATRAGPTRPGTAPTTSPSPCSRRARPGLPRPCTRR